MKIVRYASVVFILLVVLAAIAFNSVVVRIPLGAVGVRTNQYALAGGRGVVPRDFGPGWHLDLGPLHTWTRFDATVRTIEMSGRTAVQIKSADGYSVTLDLTLKYKIKPGEAHLLFRDSGSEATYERVVGNEGLDTVRSVFGTLKTEDFYNPSVRKKSSEIARGLLTEKLEARHVALVDILVRDIVFDEQYERKIKDKTLADQDVELNRSQTLAAEKRGETLEIEAEAGAAVKIVAMETESEKTRLRAETELEVARIAAEAEKYATQTRADADVLAEALRAKGTLLLRGAEAEGERLRAEALRGSGGANLVALEAMRNLALGPLSVSTERFDFLDIDSVADAFGASAVADDFRTTETFALPPLEFDAPAEAALETSPPPDRP